MSTPENDTPEGAATTEIVATQADETVTPEIETTDALPSVETVVVDSPSDSVETATVTTEAEEKTQD